VPPWDFDDCGSDAPRDTSAAAIVAEALARLAVQPDRAARATRMLARFPALIARLTPDGRLLQGCFNRPRRVTGNAELIWGDAYLLMALELLRTGRVFR
jgi:unsaturated chondroitin disaccharide hydrolase